MAGEKAQAPGAKDGGARQGGRPTAQRSNLQQRRMALPDEAREESVRVLTQILADTMALRDLYKKHHWQTRGPSFYELHLLFEKHYKEQVDLMDEVAERIQMLGGTSLAFPHDVAETTRLARPPREAEPPQSQLERLLDAHEILLEEIREGVRRCEGSEDEGTLDLLVSQLLRTHEEQIWFISQQAERGAQPDESAARQEPATGMEART